MKDVDFRIENKLQELIQLQLDTNELLKVIDAHLGSIYEVVETIERGN